MLFYYQTERKIAMLTSLGKFLRTFRIQQGELLKDMADKLNVAPAYLSSIENGKRSATKKLINNIAESYKLTEAQLLELNSAFFETLDEVNLCTKNATATQRDLCISFARKFNNLNNAQIEEIKKILEVSNK